MRMGLGEAQHGGQYLGLIGEAHCLLFFLYLIELGLVDLMPIKSN